MRFVVLICLGMIACIILAMVVLTFSSGNSAQPALSAGSTPAVIPAQPVSTSSNSPPVIPAQAPATSGSSPAVTAAQPAAPSSDLPADKPPRPAYKAWGAPIKLLEHASNDATFAVCKDGEDRIWGIVGKDRDRWLARWEDAGWRPAAVLFNTADAQRFSKDDSNKRVSETELVLVRTMERLIPGPDGSVVAVTKFVSNPSLQVRGESFRWIAPVTYKGTWAIYEDAAGVAWILGGDPKNMLIEGADNAQKPLFQLHEEDRDGDGKLLHALQMYNRPANSLLRDSLGRLWYPFQPPWDLGARNSMKTLVVFDKDARTPSDAANGLPTAVCDGTNVHQYDGRVDRSWEQSYVSFVTPKDENTYWIGSFALGLFEVDVATFKATAVSVPGRSDSRVSQIVNAHGHWYVAGDFGASFGFGLCELAKPSRLVTDQLDGTKSAFSFDFGLDRPALVTQRGLWLGCDDNGGAYFVPKDSPTGMRLDWHRGFSLPAAQFIVQLPDDRLLFAGPSGADVVVAEEKLIAMPEASSRLTRVPVKPPLLQDTHGNIWQIEWKKQGQTLERWESKEWRGFEVPLAAPFGQFARHSAACDATGRLWVTIAPEAVSIFVPPAVGSTEPGSWTQYTSYEEAVIKENPSELKFTYSAGFHRFPWFEIVNGPKGTLAFNARESLHYYDGAAWFSWRTQSITGNGGFLEGAIVAFDEATGDLYYNSGQKLYHLTEKRQWETAPEQEGGRFPMNWHSNKNGPEPPDYAPPNPKRVCKDYLGLFWLQYGSALCRAGYGLCLTIIDERQNTPLTQGGEIHEALPDPAGYVFFPLSEQDYVLLTPAEAPPKTQATVTRENAEVALIEASAGEGKNAWFTWRADEGAWQKAVVSPIEIKGLEPGQHRIEVRAIDEQFQLDPAPPSVSVTITEGGGANVLINALSSQDYAEREKAAAQLVEMGAQAVPHLNAAREKASPDLKWWIDSVLERIKASAEKKP